MRRMRQRFRVLQRRLFFLLTALCLLAAFAGFSWWVERGGLKQTDFDITVKIQERVDTSPRLRTAQFVGDIMEGSGFFASPEVSVAAVFLLTLLVAVDWKAKKIRVRALLLPVLFGLLVGAELFGKTVVHHPAPPFFMLKNPTTVFPTYHVWEEYSYPSGHAARALFIGLFSFSFFAVRRRVTLRKKVVVGLVAGIYVFFVSVSRIYLGHHWLSDVAGGWLLGGGMSLFAIGLL